MQVMAAVALLGSWKEGGSAAVSPAGILPS